MHRLAFGTQVVIVRISPWLLLRGLHVDVRAPSTAAAAVMASGGEKRRGSFGGIGTSTSFGASESSSRGYTGVGSTSRQQENPQIAASRRDDDNTLRRPRGGRGGGGAGRNATDSIEALGRCMTGILRHRAAEHDLEMQSDGYVLVADLLKLRKKTATGVPLSDHSEEDVRKAVAADGKQRFGLKEQNGQLYIRANQGHSIKTVESEQLLTLVTSPSQIPVCVHGTYEKFMSSIWQEGLKRMTRNHVHFATGLPKEDGVISGMRASAQVLIYLDVEKAMADGMKLYISANNVILTEGPVSAKYFKKVVRKFLNKEVLLTPPSQQPNQPPSQQPSQPPSQQPIQPPSQQPIQPPSQQPIQPPSQQPIQPPSQQPIQPPSQQPIQPPSQQPIQPPSQQPILPPSQQPNHPPIIFGSFSP